MDMKNNQNNQTAADAAIGAGTTPETETPVQRLAAEFQRKHRLVFMPQDDKSLFVALMKNANAFGITYKDWTGKVPETFQGAALVQTKDEEEIRFIALPTKEMAFSDPIVQDFLYDRYIRAILRSAANPEASEGQFITTSGALSVTLDNDAFAFQSGDWVEYLQGLGLKNVQKRSLKLALANAPFARSTFPRFKDWEKLLSAMAARAEKHGYSSALFSHMAATRDTAVDQTGKDISLGDMSIEALSAAVDAETEEDAE